MICPTCNRDTMSSLIDAGHQWLHWFVCCGTVSHGYDAETLVEMPMAYVAAIEALQHIEELSKGTSRTLATEVLNRYQPVAKEHK